jgi:hypothetical protein|tara:strand:+ start:738 stop:1178 length:441 start_codon:yes stop_codon:yes gene_type:complete
MNKINHLTSILLALLFLNSCGTVAEGLGGSKKKGSDEFLVEKKAPLVLPPSFGELPQPKIEKNGNTELIKDDSSNIEKIINENSSTNLSNDNNDLNNSIEESIIDKISNKEIKKLNLDEVIEPKTQIPKKRGFFKSLKDKFNNLEN